MQNNQEDAIIIFGGFVLGKHSGFTDVLLEKRIKILVLDISQNIEKINAMANHPIRYFTEYFNIEHDNFNDYSILNEVLLKWHKNYKIIGALNFKEIFNNLYSLFCAYNNFPFPGLLSNIVSLDKSIQRKLFIEYSPKSTLTSKEMIVNTTHWDKLKFPIILKPINRSGSSGVRRINNSLELKEVINTYEDKESLLIEEIIIGKEFSVETIIQNGKIIFSSITDKITNEDDTDFFVEMGHSVPSILLNKKLQKKLLEINRIILIERLNFLDGVAHVEFKINDNGEIFLIELASRPPGDSIIELYSLSLNESFEELIVNVCIGEKITTPIFKNYARQTYINHQPNKILKEVNIINSQFSSQINWLQKSGERQLHKHENLCEILIEKNKMDYLNLIKQSSDRAISFIIQATNQDELIYWNDTINKSILVDYNN